ncbi:hypothetical protein TREMEDRAFT_18081, partial [Tremella mesenterica DSM 1558]|uniref:uncharacterized protein n=1 Tax=Tremella mesenterica (strain ATCC 24925 / CBS 8224 / DSM 1558 / NBRC 9311 / NRRL Y-6157 / RJB 2259-6 / UBC 559-6) TaxID=578456 RepID=UPI0003F49AB6
SSSRWLSRHSKDPYVLKRSSSDENYRSRSSFKLLSLITRYPLFGQGSNVVDLGAAPGGWSQVAVKYVFNKQKQDQKVADNKVEQHNVMREKERRKRGSVFALDILPMEPIPDVDIITGDFLDDNDIELGEIGNVEEKDELLLDCVLSDMMAPMSGIRIRDIQASLDLVRGATQFAKTKRKLMDSMKFFSHPDLDDFKRQELIPFFDKVFVDKPKESRKESSEAYFVCMGYKG